MGEFSGGVVDGGQDGGGGDEKQKQQAEGDAPSALDETTGEPPVLLITTVDIGGGRSDRIEVRAGENTLSAARRFCAKHGLPEEVIEPLSRHLIDNLSSLVAKKERDIAKLPKVSAYILPPPFVGEGTVSARVRVRNTALVLCRLYCAPTLMADVRLPYCSRCDPPDT
jgi:hypothetical protein